MSGAVSTLAVLGVRWAEFPRSDLGPRVRRRIGRRLPSTRRILDWTVDGVPLREVVLFPEGVTVDEVTFLDDDLRGDSFVIGSLRALLGEDVTGVDPWVSFIDDRVAVLFCPQCGDLACGALSVDVHVDGEIVEWRDIGYQTGLGDERVMSTTPPVTLRFDRAQYEATVRTLLAVWSA